MNFFWLRVVSFSLLFLPFLIISGFTFKIKKEVCKSKECLAAAKNLKDSMDTKAKPCDDFYQYACGGWPKKHKHLQYPLPSSSISLRSNQNEEEIMKYLQQDNNENEPKAIHKARKLYSICLDENSYDGITQVKQILSEIGLPYLSFWTKEDSNFDYVGAIAKAARVAGVKMFFDMAVDNNPHNHSVNAIWLTKPSLEFDTNMMPSIKNHEVVKRAAQPVDEAEFIVEVVKKICGHDYPLSCGVNNVDLVKNVLKQNTERTMITLTARTKLNSSYVPTVYTLNELQKLSDAVAGEVQSSIPKLNWTRYVEKTFEGLENVTLDLRNTSEVRIVVHEMDFIKDMIRFIHQRKIKELELGLWWTVVSTIFPYADYDIFGTKISVEMPVTRENKCNKIVTSSFGMALSYMYLIKDQNGKIKIEVEEMLKHIKESYKKMFEQTPWMDQQTKEKSLKKLAAMKSLIAYPNLNELLPTLEEQYGNVIISNNFLATMIAKIQNQIRNNLNKLNEINDQTKVNWLVPPTLVNAFYVAMENSMVVPSALLGAPIYYPDNLKVFLYGSIGSTVGHEMSHGFDFNGRKYNEMGVLEEWWKNETLVEYSEKTGCFLKAYDKYDTTFEGFNQKVNSTLTLAEDVSDSGGFKNALNAYRSYISQKGQEPALVNFDTFTHEQLFTLAYANFWCENPTLLSPYLTPFMDHSPNGVRVNGVFKNSQELANIWNCPKGSKMNPSGQKCSLW